MHISCQLSLSLQARTEDDLMLAVRLMRGCYELYRVRGAVRYGKPVAVRLCFLMAKVQQ